MVGFEVEPKSVDYQQFSQQDDGTCTIKDAEGSPHPQKLNLKGRSWLIQRPTFAHTNII